MNPGASGPSFTARRFQQPGMRQDSCREGACRNYEERKFVRAGQRDKKTAEPARDQTRPSLGRLSNSEVCGRILGPVVVSDGGGIESKGRAA